MYICTNHPKTIINMNNRIISFLFLAALTILTSCQEKNPIVEIQTPKGNIKIELDIINAPVTAGHFLDLVNDGVMNGGSFYRTVRGENDTNPVKINVLQGGIQHKNNTDRFNPIEHETTEMTGLKHLDGVISMARSGPGTATTEFFLCIGDQPELDFGGKRNADGQGFAAFGKIVDGFSVAQKIWSSSAIGQRIDPQIPIHKIILAK